ncbi:sensor histidine kinase [Maricaulis maris]|uniref:histidine kinase n=1 Tax=Maricaulis maris TaxID=74318 RepID=A0A495D1R6_9PROT|nr:ATP-binding protein [Maricaulis maris]RKQ95484.1 phospho-acceptor domain-containing protein [Maricaulis maris]
MAATAKPSSPHRHGDADEYETLSGLLHAYRTPVAIILFGIMVSLALFFAALVGQSRDKELDFRSYAQSRIIELDGAISTLDVELRQLAQAIDSGLSPEAAVRIFDVAEVSQQIPIIRDMGIVENGRLTGAISPEVGRQALQEINLLIARQPPSEQPVVIPLTDAEGRNSRFALVQALPDRPTARAYIVSDFDVMLASPVGPVDPLWVVVNITDRAPTHALAGTREMQTAANPTDINISLALESAPFLVHWIAAPPYSDIRATLLPRRSFLMLTGPLPWVVLFSSFFATATIGAISLKDARRADEVRREVTRKTAELSRSNAIIAAKNAELDRFASHASHDLQAPLRAMKGISSLLVERQLNLDQRSREMLERINRGADRAQRLVQDLLTYTRAERKEARVERIEPDEIRSEIEELLGAVIADADARLEWALDGPIHADRFLLVRMFQNLIANAIKYRRDERPLVRIASRDAGDNILISVSDNGIGIDKAYFGRIFEVFERLHGGDAYEGTGIGLALCQRAAELHGGDISVASSPGEGSCFTVRLPANLAPQIDAGDNDETGGDRPPRLVSNDR